MRDALPGDGTSKPIGRWVVALVLTTLVVATTAGLVAANLPSRYVSVTSFLVGPVTSDLDTLRASESLTSTYSQLLLRPQALQQTAQLVQRSPKMIADDSDVTFNTETRIVTLTVDTDQARASERIAASLTTQLTQLVGTIDPTSPGALRILSVQPQDSVPVTRSPIRYALLAGAGWILIVASLVAALAAGGPRGTRQARESSEAEVPARPDGMAAERV